MASRTQPKRANTPSSPEPLFACAGLILVGFLYRAELFAFDPAKWATLSAWVLLLAGIWIARAHDQHFEHMLRRLKQREAIALSPEGFEQWLQKVRHRAHESALIGSLVFPALILVAYTFVYVGERLNGMDTLQRIWLVAEVTLEVIAARIIGRYVGRGISYGFLGKHLAKDEVTLNVIPGHSDNTAGLRPIGDFYFYQATVTALPVFFFAFWVLVIPLWSTIAPAASLEFASQWKNTYLVFFFIALGIEVLAFILPLWFFHREMSVQKQNMRSRADELSATLSKLQRDITSQERLRDYGEERTQLVEQIALLENLPTWALAPDVRQRFAWGNLACLSPFALQLSQTILDAVSKGTS